MCHVYSDDDARSHHHKATLTGEAPSGAVSMEGDMAVTNKKTRRNNMFGFPYMMNNGMSWRDLKDLEEWIEERDKKKREREKDKDKRKPFPNWTFGQWVLILCTAGPWVGAIQWNLLKYVFGW